MAWQTILVPLHPRTHRTADGTFYTHDGTGRLQVRDHHAPEIGRRAGAVRTPSATASRPRRAGEAVAPRPPAPAPVGVPRDPTLPAAPSGNARRTASVAPEATDAEGASRRKS
jgi:hypothetical protein